MNFKNFSNISLDTNAFDACIYRKIKLKHSFHYLIFISSWNFYILLVQYVIGQIIWINSMQFLQRHFFASSVRTSSVWLNYLLDLRTLPTNCSVIMLPFAKMHTLVIDAWIHLNVYQLNLSFSFRFVLNWQINQYLLWNYSWTTSVLPWNSTWNSKMSESRWHTEIRFFINDKKKSKEKYLCQVTNDT